ncbi:MAG: nucleotidyl transferase AbiEii/AbiGii toxin family protein [Planctomycetota bacterium]
MLSYESQLDSNLQWALREGSMHFEGESAVHVTLRRLVERLEKHKIDYAIAGGMALFFHGYRRFTEDVDFLVTAEGLQKIHQELDGLGYVRLFEKSKNLRDATTGVKIDFLVAGQFPGDGKPGPIAFPTPTEVGVEIDGANVVRLPRLIELKLASGQANHRIKDLGDVQELIRALSLPQNLTEDLHSSLQESYDQLWHAVQQNNDEFPEPPTSHP